MGSIDVPGGEEVVNTLQYRGAFKNEMPVLFMCSTTAFKFLFDLQYCVYQTREVIFQVCACTVFTRSNKKKQEVKLTLILPALLILPAGRQLALNYWMILGPGLSIIYAYPTTSLLYIYYRIYHLE